MTRTRRSISSLPLAVWLRKGRGATAVEYLVALILCALVVLGVSKLFGDTLYEKYKMGDARISDMERNQRSMDNGSGGDGSLVSANQIDDVNAAGSGSKTQVSRKHNTSMSAFADGDSQLSQEEQKRLMAKRLATGSGGYAYSKTSGEQGGSGGEEKDSITDPEQRKQQYALRGEKPPEPFRFNPVILIIIAMLLLGLGYMMVKGNKEEG